MTLTNAATYNRWVSKFSSSENVRFKKLTELVMCTVASILNELNKCKKNRACLYQKPQMPKHQ